MQRILINSYAIKSLLAGELTFEKVLTLHRNQLFECIVKVAMDFLTKKTCEGKDTRKDIDPVLVVLRPIKLPFLIDLAELLEHQR